MPTIQSELVAVTSFSLESVIIFRSATLLVVRVLTSTRFGVTVTPSSVGIHTPESIS